MARSWFTVSKAAVVLILGILIAIPIARICGQSRVQVAPAAKSDSFAQEETGESVRIQQREIPATNFRIAGIDLAATEDPFDQVTRVLGPTPDQASGDDDFRDEVCYNSSAPHDTTHLIVGEGYVEFFFLLSADSSAWAWKVPCKPSPKITRDLGTSSGLHLGQTQQQVIAILGLPSGHEQNLKTGMDEMMYNLEADKKLSPQDMQPSLQDALKHNSKLDQRAWLEKNSSYIVWVSIDAKFKNDHLTSLKILWTNGA